MPLTQLFGMLFFLEESFFYYTTFSFIHFRKCKCNAIHFKGNHTKRFGHLYHSIFTFSVVSIWFDYPWRKRCAMCLADRIKSATRPSKGHKEVYLKRERCFFREFLSLGPREDKNIISEDKAIQLSSVPETQQSKAMSLRVIKLAGLTRSFLSSQPLLT